MAKAAAQGAATDGELVARVAERDYPAFVELFDRHRASAVSFAARMTGNPEVAESAAHDAFVRAQSRASRFRDKRPFRVWFFAFLREIVAERLLGRDAAHAGAAEKLAVLGPVSEEAPSSADAGGAEALYEALNQLEPIYREVVYLRMFEHMRYDEIAAVTGERERTVRARMDIAVEHLRKAVRT